MTYRFKLHEPIGQAVRRVGLEQIEIATAKLAGTNDIATAIHDARRCLKRLRALLRLIEPGLVEAQYRREAARLAGIGRLLSNARDLDVMRQTLGNLEDRFQALPAGATDRLARFLAQNQGHTAGVDGRRQALSRLEQSKRFFAAKATAGIELDHLLEGLGRAYRKARKAFRHAYREPSEEAFHACRKRVQLHWRHMALLSRGWPEALSARASEAKEMSRLLGEDHDYAVLLALARDRGKSILEPGDLEALTALCTSCQAQLRAAAKPRGDRLFAEPVKNLQSRVGLYWRSAQCLANFAAGEGRPRALPEPSAKVKGMPNR
ncbi:MAG: CHAD domain-containing protein, partial [Hyphomicrobiaceae bacterium]|nr:CHAD domain-containing protein [Hyphomicrobiaceae bacterium]